MSLLKKQKNNQKLSTKLTWLCFGAGNFVNNHFWEIRLYDGRKHFWNILTFNKEKSRILTKFFSVTEVRFTLKNLKVKKVQKVFQNESYFSQRKKPAKIVHKIDPQLQFWPIFSLIFGILTMAYMSSSIFSYRTSIHIGQLAQTKSVIFSSRIGKSINMNTTAGRMKYFTHSGILLEIGNATPMGYMIGGVLVMHRLHMGGPCCIHVIIGLPWWKRFQFLPRGGLLAFVSMPPVGGHGNRVTRWGSRSIFTLKLKF